MTAVLRHHNVGSEHELEEGGREGEREGGREIERDRDTAKTTSSLSKFKQNGRFFYIFRFLGRIMIIAPLSTIDSPVVCRDAFLCAIVDVTAVLQFEVSLAIAHSFVLSRRCES